MAHSIPYGIQEEGDDVQMPLQKKDLLVMDMTFREQKQLASILDADYSGMGGWRELAAAAGISQEIIIKIDCSYHTGGESSVEFFQILEHMKPDITISDFCKVLEELKRKDVIEKLQKYEKTQQLWGIERTDRVGIELLLRLDDSASRSDWRMVADKYGLSSKIKIIESSTQKSSSPMLEFLSTLTSFEPNFTWGKLEKVAQDIGRNDIVRCMRKMREKRNQTVE